MILLRNLRMELGEKSEALPKKAAKKLEIPQKDIEEFRLVKRSLDARKKKDIHYILESQKENNYSKMLESKSQELLKT